MDTNNPEIEKPLQEADKNAPAQYIRDIREARDKETTFMQRDTAAQDFYYKLNPFAVSNLDKKEYEEFLKTLDPEDKTILAKGDNYYQLTFKNIGGLPMPLIIQFEYTDGSNEVFRIPVEIWRQNADKVSKVFASNKEVKQISLDPFLETPDIDTSNNYYPAKPKASRLQLFKQKQTPENPMQRDKRDKKG